MPKIPDRNDDVPRPVLDLPGTDEAYITNIFKDKELLTPGEALKLIAHLAGCLEIDRLYRSKESD